MSIHLRIRQARVQASLSQSQLARLMGVSRSACNQWESGAGPAPRRERLARLAQLLSVQYEWLATGAGLAQPSAVKESRGHYAPVLSPDQQELLEIYRAMTPKRRSALLDFLRALR